MTIVLKDDGSQSRITRKLVMIDGTVTSYVFTGPKATASYVGAVNGGTLNLLDRHAQIPVEQFVWFDHAPDVEEIAGFVARNWEWKLLDGIHLPKKTRRMAKTSTPCRNPNCDICYHDVVVMDTDV